MATIRENEEIKNGLRLIVKKAEKEEPYIILEESVKKYLFKLNSNDVAVVKDNNIMAELTIEGEYREEVADKASQFMSEWATETTGAAYKYVELIRFDENMVRKRYVFPNAFIVDYEEFVNEAAGVVTFKLFIKQTKDKRTAFKMHVNEILSNENKEESSNE